MKTIDLTILHRAGYALAALQTHEPDRAVEYYRSALKSNGAILEWDCVRGIDGDREKNTPIALIAYIDAAGPNTVVFAHNLQEFLRQVPVQQMLKNSLSRWRSNGKMLVILCPSIGIVPAMLEREMTQIDFELPDEMDIRKRFIQLAESANVKLPDKAASEAARGLTLAEAENAGALALASTGKFDREIISWQKSQAVMRNSSLEVSAFKERFEDLAAMENLKGFTLKTAKSALAKGVIILGVPGTGKSHCAKALGNELDIPCLTLDFGRCFGSLVGESLRGDQELYFCDQSGGHVERKTIAAAYKDGHLPFTYSYTDNGGFVRARVLDVIQHERKEPFIRIQTRRGKSVVVTTGHSVFVRAQGRGRHFGCTPAERGGHLVPCRADALKVGDRIATAQHWGPPKRGIERVEGGVVEFPVTEQLGVLCGLWLGDGSLNRVYLRISCAKKDSEVVTFLRTLGPLIDCCKGGEGIDYTIASLQWSAALHELGVCGTPIQRAYSHTKRVPTVFFGASSAVVSALLRGYFSADGSFSGHNLEASTVSLALANDIAMLLGRFGIAPYIVRKRMRVDQKHYHQSYRLTVSKAAELAQFRQHIGFLQAYKNQALDDYLVAQPASKTQRRGQRSIERSKFRQRFGVLWDEVTALEPIVSNDAHSYDLSVEGVQKFMSGGVIVHNSERLIRDALATVVAMRPCVLLIDEIEKGLAGAGSNGQHDSGVTKRTTGTFLKFLSDRPDNIYVVATCNDVTSLPPEYVRAERWDALFFVDLPTSIERQAILDIHTKAFGLKAGKFGVPDGWTGSEIKTCCRIAKMMGTSLEDAAQYVVPLSKSASGQIQALREWAKGRTIPASLPATEKGGRKVSLGGN